MSKVNNRLNLILAILQMLVAILWAFAAFKHSNWYVGFISGLFVAISISTLEIWALREKLENETTNTP